MAEMFGAASVAIMRTHVFSEGNTRCRVKVISKLVTGAARTANTEKLVCQAVAFISDKLGNALGPFAAQAIHIVLRIDLPADPLEATVIARRGFPPRFSRQRQLQLVAYPRNCCLMQEHIPKLPWLQTSVFSLHRSQVLASQRPPILRRHRAIGMEEAPAFVGHDNPRLVLAWEAAIQNAHQLADCNSGALRVLAGETWQRLDV